MLQLMYIFLENLDMPKYLTISEAQEKLSSLPDELNSEIAIITSDGKPVMIALNYEYFQSIVETLDILSDDEFAAQIRVGIQQAEKGETISWEEAKAKLGW
jgi:PHD/YefM family antitoxin component YafN of YafNO toxin-antitoxin module